MLVTEQGIVIRTTVDEIRRAGRVTQGVRIIRVGDGDRVVSVAKIEEQDPIDDIEEEVEDR